MVPTQFPPNSQPPVPKEPIRQLTPADQPQPPVYPEYKRIFTLALAILVLEGVVILLGLLWH